MSFIKTGAELTFSERFSFFISKRFVTLAGSIALKSIAFVLNPSSTQMVDLQRLSINFASNAAQMTIQKSFKSVPDYKHNYGYGKLLSFGMTLQGTMLIVDGVYWLGKCMSLPVTGVALPSLASLGFLSLGLLVESASFAYPIDLIYPSMSLLDRLKLAKSILTREIRTQWVLENMTTTALLNVIGGSLPFVLQLISLLAGHISFLESLGTALSGLLEIGLGGFILYSNLGILASRSLGRRDVANLVRIIESRPSIMKLDGLKTNYISSREVKLMALIRYNTYYLKKRLLQDMNKDLRESQLTVEERRRVESLLCNLVDLTLTHTTEVVRDMEKDLRSAFPHATYIDLECVLSRDKKRFEED